MKINSSKFKKFANQIGIITGCFALIFSLLLWLAANEPFAAEDLITFGLMATYFIGIALGVVRKLMGGLLIIAVILYFLTEQMYHLLLEENYTTDLYFLLLTHLILIIPGILYLMSWRLERKSKDT